MTEPTHEILPTAPRAPLIDMAATAKAMAAEGAEPTTGTAPPPEAIERAARAPRVPGGAKKKSGAQRRKEKRDGQGGAPALDGEIVEGPAPGEVAAQFNGLAFGLMILVAGESAKPSPDELKLCNGAMTAYLAAHPDFQVRPELLLVAAYVPYFVRSVATPTFRDKIAYAAGRGWSALRSMFRKKEKTDEATRH